MTTSVHINNTIIIMPESFISDSGGGGEHYVAGCHGTVAEQQNEDYYDDRSDADDDMEKGKIKFPKNKLYGRDRELDILLQLYRGITDDCRVVFLSGYSGVGKSALVNEFINQAQQQECKNESASPLLHFSGKYIQQSGGAAPFSAISEMFSNMVASLTNLQLQKERRGPRDKGAEDKKHDDEGAVINPVCSRVWERIQKSDVIGPDTEGNGVLLNIFPSLRPLLDGSCISGSRAERRGSIPNGEGGNKNGEIPSMNAVKESTRELLNALSSSLQRPLIFFLDDLQWADGPSMELLLFLFSDVRMKNLMFICAYRSNEVGPEHPFANVMTKVTESRGQLVSKVDLFSLSQEAISQFIADSIGKDEVDEVSELVEVIYPKTMGNIFCVMQALEELVRKNALYYDVMCFEWRWATVSKVELANQVSADVVETIKEKIKGLPDGIQSLLVVMSFIPCSVGASVLNELLMNYGDNRLTEDEIASLLKKASEEGMLMRSMERGNYAFAHDRIREASRAYVEEESYRDELVLHLADVLQRIGIGKGSKMEWCMYTAVDLLNSLPSEKVDVTDLIKLNLKVSRLSKSRGSPEKENVLLREAAVLLEQIKWKDYDLSLEVYDAVIKSEFILGHHDKLSSAVGEVLNNAKSLRDKLSAYMHRVKSQCEKTKDYKMAAREGVKVLNMFSYNIPLDPTRSDLAREKIKLKLALKGRSYSHLATLPVIEDPIFELFSFVCRDSLFSGQPKLLLMAGYSAIRRALSVKGIDKNFPLILVMIGTLLGKKGKVRTANEIGNVALMLSENFRNNKSEHAFTRFASYAGIIFYLQSFRSGVDILLQCYKDLKFAGQFDFALGSMLNYFYAYLAAGFSVGAILESKLLVLEEFCESIEQNSFKHTFEIHRQFVMNLRQKSHQPTVLDGPAFYQETALAEMNDNSRKMTLRDATTFRLQLAFIFKDTDCMASMLEILSDYPFEDQVLSRFFIRACFMGLAAFSVAEKNSVIGNQCLSYFRRMMKLGSINAPPAYFFIMALKKPSKKSFTAAVESCIEASMPHLEAMARERFAMFLQTQNETELANSHISCAYFLYYDYGAHGKALALTKEYPFLEKTARTKARSITSSRADTAKHTTASTTESALDASVKINGIIRKRGVFEFNSALSRRQLVRK